LYRILSAVGRGLIKREVSRLYETVLSTADNIMNLTALFSMQDVAVMQLGVYGDCILNSGDGICISDDQGGDDESEIATHGAVLG
jgi:hypothetical protein